MAVILIVDDEPMIREAIAFQLRSEGYEINTAANGVEALAHVQRQRVDLVVTDVRMPELDGLSLLKSLRRFGFQMPVVVMTASLDVARSEFEMLGVLALLSKPFCLNELVSVLHTAIPAH